MILDVVFILLYVIATFPILILLRYKFLRWREDRLNPPPPPPLPPRPPGNAPLLDRVRWALLQSMLRAGWAFIEALTICPACGASAPPPSKDGPAPPPSEAEPALRPAFVEPLGSTPPPVSTADNFICHEKTRRVGALQFEAFIPRYDPVDGRLQLSSYSLSLSCEACKMSLSFANAEVVANPADALAQTATPQGPRRQWSVAPSQGAGGGVISAGQGAPSQIKAKAGASFAALFALKHAQAVIDRALDFDLSQLPVERHDLMRVHAVRRILPMIAAKLVNTKRV